MNRAAACPQVWGYCGLLLVFLSPSTSILNRWGLLKVACVHRTRTALARSRTQNIVNSGVAAEQTLTAWKRSAHSAPECSHWRGNEGLLEWPGVQCGLLKPSIHNQQVLDGCQPSDRKGALCGGRWKAMPSTALVGAVLPDDSRQGFRIRLAAVVAARIIVPDSMPRLQAPPFAPTAFWCAGSDGAVNERAPRGSTRPAAH